jgi:hypothetical protein
VLGRGDVPLDALEDQDVVPGGALRGDFAVGVHGAAVVGVPEVAVFRERQPVHPVAAGGVELLRDLVFGVVAVLRMHVVVADQPGQLRVVAFGPTAEAWGLRLRGTCLRRAPGRCPEQRCASGEYYAPAGAEAREFAVSGFDEHGVSRRVGMMRMVVTQR